MAGGGTRQSRAERGKPAYHMVRIVDPCVAIGLVVLDVLVRVHVDTKERVDRNEDRPRVGVDVIPVVSASGHAVTSPAAAARGAPSQTSSPACTEWTARASA
jgi:hypothetical protein